MIGSHRSLYRITCPSRFLPVPRERLVQLASPYAGRPSRFQHPPTVRSPVPLWRLPISIFRKSLLPEQWTSRFTGSYVTSCPLHTEADARTLVRYYTYRWLIERFHYVLKSGCRLEDRQLRTRARLQRLLGVFSDVAWHLLWLTYQSRQTPEAPCTRILARRQWQILYRIQHPDDALPNSPPTLHQAVGWIAQLGGFLARTNDGEPGVKVLWRGWRRLQDMVKASKLSL